MSRRTSTSWPTGTAVIRAEFPGHCERCERPYSRGALVTLGRHGWAHQWCNDEGDR